MEQSGIASGGGTPLGGCDQGDGAVKYPTLPLWVTVIRVMELSGIAPCPHWVTVIRVMEQSGSHPAPSGWL